MEKYMPIACAWCGKGGACDRLLIRAPAAPGSPMMRWHWRCACQDAVYGYLADGMARLCPPPGYVAGVDFYAIDLWAVVDLTARTVLAVAERMGCAKRTPKRYIAGLRLWTRGGKHHAYRPGMTPALRRWVMAWVKVAAQRPPVIPYRTRKGGRLFPEMEYVV